VSKKTVKIVFGKTVSNFHSPTLIQKWPRRYYYVGLRCTYLPPHLIYVNALPCETQMLQIVTLCGDYL